MQIFSELLYVLFNDAFRTGFADRFMRKITTASHAWVLTISHSQFFRQKEELVEKIDQRSVSIVKRNLLSDFSVVQWPLNKTQTRCHTHIV